MYKKSEKIRIVMDEMRNGLNKLPMACKKAEISLSIWYYWEQDNPRLLRLRRAAERILKANRDTAVIDANFKAAIKGNVAAQCFYLKNNCGWEDTMKHEGMNTQVNVYPNKTIVFQDLNDDKDGTVSDTDAEKGATGNRIQSTV